MIQKDDHHGKVHDDQVNILKEEGFEVNLLDGVPFQVFIKCDELYEDHNSEYKQLFLQYAKGIDPSLTDEALNDYWKQTMEDSTNNVDFDEFELKLSMNMDGYIEYLTIIGTVQEQ